MWWNVIGIRYGELSRLWRGFARGVKDNNVVDTVVTSGDFVYDPIHVPDGFS